LLNGVGDYGLHLTGLIRLDVSSAKALSGGSRVAVWRFLDHLAIGDRLDFCETPTYQARILGSMNYY
jgi:hypothetical protein